MTARVAAPRARKSFSRLKHVLDLPNLIDIQKASFEWFKNEGLRETIDDISPIEDYTGTLAIEFAEYKFGVGTIRHESGRRALRAERASVRRRPNGRASAIRSARCPTNST